MTSSDGGVTGYGYDKVGHITSESLVLSGVTYKSQSATYDAAGRLTAWADAGGSTIPAASLAIAYDAAGNVRNRTTTYRQSVGGSPIAFTDWFRYDSMNRITVDRGALSGGVIYAPAQYPGTVGGVSYTYDLAGNRLSATSAQMYHNVGNYYYQGDYYYHDEWIALTYATAYAYDDAGRITQTTQRNQRNQTADVTNPDAPKSWADRTS